jgi:hypothetical protein
MRLKARAAKIEEGASLVDAFFHKEVEPFPTAMLEVDCAGIIA